MTTSSFTEFRFANIFKLFRFVDSLFKKHDDLLIQPNDVENSHNAGCPKSSFLLLH